MTNDTCGEPTADGTPCERTAGFGTDREGGPCYDHTQDRPVLRKFTPERRERILGAAPTGAFKKHIAQLAEIGEDTLHRWIQMGETDAENGLDTELASFYRDWQRARGMGAIKRLNDVDDKFVLERAYGYNRTDRLEHSGPGGDPIQTEDVTDEERELLEAAFDTEPDT